MQPSYRAEPPVLPDEPPPSGHAIPVDDSAERIRSLRRFASFLDTAVTVPGTEIRLGFDSIIGLIPGAGDLIGAVLSLYVVYLGALIGVPRLTLVRMCGNVLLDSAVGAIPLLGDLFDVTWKANRRNVALIEDSLSRGHPRPRSPRTVGRMGRNVVLTLVIGVAATAALLIAIVIALLVKALG